MRKSCISRLTAVLLGAVLVIALMPGYVNANEPAPEQQQIVTQTAFEEEEFSPNGDGVADTVTGSITLAQKAKISVWITNAAKVNVKNVMTTQELEAGVHTFTWDGKDFMDSFSPNGPYWIRVTVEENGTAGYVLFEEVKVNLTGSFGYTVPEPAQKVKVMVPSSKVTVGPYLQRYMAQQGETFPVMSSDGQNYEVLVNRYVRGTIPINDVELTDLDNIPITWGTTVKDNTSVRKGPGSGYEEVTILPKGEQVRVLRLDGTWYRVLLASGQQAYIQVSDLNYENTTLVLKNMVISNPVISPKYNDKTPLTSISFELARKARVSIWLQNGAESEYIYTGENENGLVILEPGKHSINWDGLNKWGYPVLNGTYKVYIATLEPLNQENKIWENSSWTITVAAKDSDRWSMPETRVKEIVTGTSVVPDIITPGEPGKDKANIQVTLNEAAEIQMLINNKPEIPLGVPPVYDSEAVKLDKGEHIFTWDGTDNYGSRVSTGTYYAYLMVKDATGAYAYYLLKDHPITVKEQVVQPSPEPTPSPGPTITIKYSVVAGDTLWKIAQRHGTTIGEIVKLNNLDVNKPLLIGQQLLIAVKDEAEVPGTGGNQPVHTVIPGDTLWKIALKYGTTVDKIVVANNLDPAKYLAIGQKLLIPVQTPGEPAPQPTVTYTVVAGDVLWKIAQKYGTTVSAIAQINNIDPNRIYVGQKLVIPTGSVPLPQPQPIYYTVAAGDTLWKIAQKYNTTVVNLSKLNQLDPNKPIFPGQKIKVSA